MLRMYNLPLSVSMLRIYILSLSVLHRVFTEVSDAPLNPISLRAVHTVF